MKIFGENVLRRTEDREKRVLHFCVRVTMYDTLHMEELVGEVWMLGRKIRILILEPQKFQTLLMTDGEDGCFITSTNAMECCKGINGKKTQDVVNRIILLGKKKHQNWIKFGMARETRKGKI